MTCARGLSATAELLLYVMLAKRNADIRICDAVFTDKFDLAETIFRSFHNFLWNYLGPTFVAGRYAVPSPSADAIRSYAHFLHTFDSEKFLLFIIRMFVCMIKSTCRSFC